MRGSAVVEFVSLATRGTQMEPSDQTNKPPTDSLVGNVTNCRLRKNRSGAQRRRARKARLRIAGALTQGPCTGVSLSEPGPSRGAPLEGTSGASSATSVVPGPSGPSTGVTLSEILEPIRGALLVGPSGASSATPVVPGPSGTCADSQKRSRAPDQIPPSRHETKRPRLSDNVLPEVVSDLRVCIFEVGYPQRLLTNEKINAIQEKVAEVLDRTLEGLDEIGHIPRFQGFRFRRGALFVNCYDERSRNWLTELITSLRLEGCLLRIIPAADISRHRWAVVHFKGPELALEVILSRMERQNPGLGCQSWLIYGIERVGFATTRMVVGFWERSIELLRTLQFQPFFMLGRATVKLLGTRERTEERTDEAEGPSHG